MLSRPPDGPAPQKGIRGCPPYPVPMARAWVELPPDAWLAYVRRAASALHELCYATAEIRGTGPVLLRLSGAKLESGELWRYPGQR